MKRKSNRSFHEALPLKPGRSCAREEEAWDGKGGLGQGFYRDGEKFQMRARLVGDTGRLAGELVDKFMEGA